MEVTAESLCPQRFVNGCPESTVGYCLIVSENCFRPKRGKQPCATDPALSRYNVPLRTWLEGVTPYSAETPFSAETTLLTGSQLCGGLVRFETAAGKVEPSALELEFIYGDRGQEPNRRRAGRRVKLARGEDVGSPGAAFPVAVSPGC